MVGMLWGGEPLSFDRMSWRSVKLKHPGSETVRIENVFLEKAGRTAKVVTWGTPSPPAIELVLQSESPALEKFKQAEFSLTLYVPEVLPLRRISLRLADRSGEIFQFVPVGMNGLKQGKNELHYKVDAVDLQTNIWGGDGNKKIDWPLRVAGIAIDMNRQTPGDRWIRFDSLEYRLSGEHATISLRTGHRLNLLLPNWKAQPELVIRNTGLEPLELTGTLTVSDADNGIRIEPVSCRVISGGEALLPLPGDYTQQGWWKADYRLKGPAGKEFTGTHRFARMNPAGPTPERAQEFLFGLCGHPERSSPEEVELEALAAGLCGAKILRVDFRWSRIQRKREQWNFSTYDRLADVFGRNGVELQCLLGYDVSWAISTAYKPSNPKLKGRPRLPDFDDFAKFVETVAARYKDRIQYYEIWNEPDLVAFANFPPESYMELLQHGYAAVKRVAPDAKVMNGGLASVYTNKGGSIKHNNGLLELLLADGGESFDLFAFHGHGAFKVYTGHLRGLRKYGLIGPGAPRPWYSNETAESSAAIGERKQSASLFKKLLYAWANGAMGYNWYLLREKNAYPPGHHERHFGLITAEFEPKPAYITYNMLANTYKGSRFLRMPDLGPGVYGCLFENLAGEKLLALWSEGPARTVSLAGLPSGITRIDLFGNESQLAVQNGLVHLTVSEEPFTLRMPKMPEDKQLLDDRISAGELPRQSIALNGKHGELTLQLAKDQYYSLIESAPGNESFYWKGTEDLSADVLLSRRGETLLFQVKVRDDVHMQPYQGSEVWNGDGIQFALRLPGQDGFWKFGLTRLADGKPEVYCWSRPAGFYDAVSAIRLETNRDEVHKRTVYRAEIPFRAIGMTQQIMENGFRFNLVINDNDGNLREGYLAVALGLGVETDEAAWPLVNLR